ncbi:MAG: BMP family ABC transporter substrate-binding protein [Clostridiales bacterium]|nr:BMP family ABC transporter substrate-binding protein [Clostridiales bacterium]
MKKFLALILALVMALALVACGNKDSGTTDTGKTDEKPFKVGIVLVGDENEGYSAAHIQGVKDAMNSLGLTDENVVWKYSIGEDESCDAACTDCVEQGCTLVITNSYGHQSHCKQAAIENPEVQFVSMTGDTAKADGLDNFSNAFTRIYEARYVSGVVAGMKVAELVKDGKLSDANYDKDGNVKIGYVGAYPYAEVVSGYTAFYLGIKSAYEKVSMQVTYTNSWFDLQKEGAAAESLMADGCVIIGQHADSTGAPAAVEAAYKAGKVAFSVGYNIDMLSVAPDVALTSSTNNWGVYYTYAIGAAMKGEKIATNWAEGFDKDAVAITKLGTACAEGTADKVAEVEAALKAGTLHVFDTATFTAPASSNNAYQIDANGHVTSAFCVDTNGDFTYDTEEAIKDGYYDESVYQSAPSFTIRINGITENS